MNDTYLKKAFISILMVSFLSLHSFACSNQEESARQMLNKVLTLQQTGKYEEANKTIQNIIRNYPETKVAAELREIVLVSKEEIERSKQLPQKNKKLQNQPQPLSPQEQEAPPPIRQSLVGLGKSKALGIRKLVAQFLGKFGRDPSN
jgi:hypothetical protein